MLLIVICAGVDITVCTIIPRRGVKLDDDALSARSLYTNIGRSAGGATEAGCRNLAISELGNSSTTSSVISKGFDIEAFQGRHVKRMRRV